MKFSAAKLAELAGISQPAITKAVQKGQLVKGRDKKFDSDYPQNKSWMVAHDVKFTRSGAKPKKTKLQSTQVTLDGGHADLRSFEELTGLPERLADMSMRELVYQYGDLKAIGILADTLNKIMAAAQRDVKIQESRKELIPREFAMSHLFRYVDLMNNQILEYFDSIIETEIAEVLADSKNARIKLPIMHKANASKIIKDCKSSITQSVKKLKVENTEETEDE